MRRKERDSAVFPVVARLPAHAALPQAAQRLGRSGAGGALHLLRRAFPQDAELRPQALEQAEIGRLHALARRGSAQHVRQQLRQGQKALKGPAVRRRRALRPVGQRLHAVRDADGHALAADRAEVVQLDRAARLQAAAAGAVAVEVVLPLLRKELDRALEPLTRLDGALERGIAPPAGQEVRLAPQLVGRVRVGVRDELKPVQHGAAPVHRRVGGKARLQRVHMGRQVPEAFLHRIEPGKRPEEREVRRPDVRRDVHGLRARLQHDLQQVVAVQAEDGPAVAVQVPDGLELLGQGLRLVQARQQQHVVHLPRAPAALVDRADLAGDDETRLLRLHFRGQAQVLAQAVQSLLRGDEGLAQLCAPGGVRKVARAHDPQALIPRPEVQMRRVAVAAGRAREPRVNVQIRKNHPVSSSVAFFPDYTNLFAPLQTRTKKGPKRERLCSLRTRRSPRPGPR